MRTNIPEGVEIPSEEESTEVGELTNGRELGYEDNRVDEAPK